MSCAGRVILLCACFAAACGEDEGSDPGPVTGMPVILELSASPASVQPNVGVELHWKVENARVIEITSDEGTLVSTFELESTVMTPPLHGPTTLVLTARSSDAEATKSLQIDVTWPDPKAELQVEHGGAIYVGDALRSTWDSTGAERERLLVNDRPVLERYVWMNPLESVAFFTVSSTHTVIRLESINPKFTRTKEIELEALPTPWVDVELEPRTWTGGIVTATVTWQSTSIDRTELRVNNRLVPGFPGTSEGTYSFPLDTSGQVELWGINERGGIGDYVDIAGPALEMEPNDFVSLAQDINASSGAIGTLSSSNDVDVYWLNAFSTTLVVRTLNATAIGCDLDTRLLISIPGDQVIADASVGALTPCARAEVMVPFGTQLFIEVHAEAGSSGDYLLLVEPR